MAADAANFYLPPTPYTLLANDAGIMVPQPSSGAGLASMSLNATFFPSVAAFALAPNTPYNVIIYSVGASAAVVQIKDSGLSASIVYGGGLTHPPTSGGNCRTGYSTHPTTGTWNASNYCACFYVSA